VGLIKVLTTTANANLKTSGARSNAAIPEQNRLTNHAPHIASSAFPPAINNEVATFPAVRTLKRNAPKKMPGQIR